MIEDMNLPNQVIRSLYRKASSSNTSAIVSSCARKRRPIISPLIYGSGKAVDNLLNYSRGCALSLTAI
jgi:hypothetical protein